MGEHRGPGPPVDMAVDQSVAALSRGRTAVVPGDVVKISRRVEVSLAVEAASLDPRVDADARDDELDRSGVGKEAIRGRARRD